jgi:hypothetical protein
MKQNRRPIVFESNPPNGLNPIADNMYIAAENKKGNRELNLICIKSHYLN